VAKKATKKSAAGPKARVKKAAKAKNAKQAKKGKAPGKRAKAAAAAKTGKAAKKAVKRKAKAAKTGRLRTPLTKAELAEFRQMLLEKRRSLLGDMDGMANEALRRNLGDRSGELSTIPTHKADIGTDNYEQEFTLGLLESEQQMLREIDQALERIENGTYGMCLGTGKPIGKARLRARPWAKYCIEYARQIEKGMVKPQKEDEDRLLAEMVSLQAADEDEDEDELVEEELDLEGQDDSLPEDEVSEDDI